MCPRPFPGPGWRWTDLDLPSFTALQSLVLCIRNPHNYPQVRDEHIDFFCDYFDTVLEILLGRPGYGTRPLPSLRSITFNVCLEDDIAKILYGVLSEAFEELDEELEGLPKLERVAFVFWDEGGNVFPEEDVVNKALKHGLPRTWNKGLLAVEYEHSEYRFC